MRANLPQETLDLQIAEYVTLLIFLMELGALENDIIFAIIFKTDEKLSNENYIGRVLPHA